MQTVSVLGLGYVGLPSAAVFAQAGLKVIGVDVNQDAVDTINSGRAHIVEPGLDALLETVVGNGNLCATTKAEASDVFVIAVPTPFKEEKQPDLKFIKSAAEMIAPLIAKGNLIILESTSPVGATQQLAKWLQQARSDLKIPELGDEDGDIFLSYCPERILPGKVIQELVENDRIVGGINPKSSKLAIQFYKHAVKGECHVTDCRTAELCKLSENSFRDVNIAFANELSVISHDLGVDVYELISLTNRHPRVNILQPGTGVGGHCIAVDPWFIVDSAPQQSRLIRTAREVNDAKPEWVVDRVAEMASDIENPSIACMGLAYKPDVDDLRESPSVEAVKNMASRGIGELLVCEPFVDELPSDLAMLGLENQSVESAVANADIVVFLTAHNQFRAVAVDAAGSKQVIDACGLTR